MFFNPTISRRLRVLGGFLLALSIFAPLRAQVEPELMTTTDTLDVYKREAGRSQLVTVMDLTTASRAVFETKSYLTSSSRDYSISYVGIANLTSLTAGKDLGFLFVLVDGTVGTQAKVALLQWPQTGKLWPSNAAPVLGDAWNFDGSSSGAAVTYQATNTATIQLITHVRFTVAGRTIDLPCPSRIFDSPYPVLTLDQVVSAGIINYQKHARTGITYDVWSDNNSTLVDSDGNFTTNLQNSIPKKGLGGLTYTLTPIGNFYYTFDFFTWIFASKQIRNPAGVRQTSYIAAPTSGNYASPGGYAIPQITETTSVPGFGSVLAKGWFNGLSGLTRAMAQKVASINVYLDKSSGINWIYRFVDPNVDNASSEEQGAAVAAFPTNPNQSSLWSDNNRANWKFLRKLVTADLMTNKTSIQVTGPSGWYQVYVGGNPSYVSMDEYDFGNRHNLDPRTPQPWAYALANTYYRVGIEQEKTVFDTVNTTCPGKTYVMIFPSVGLTDSYAVSSASISGDVAAGYLTYSTTGNTGLNKGSTSALPALSTLTPYASTFFSGVLSCTAAFGDSSNNSGAWHSAWEINPSASRGPKNPGIQTLVASVGIPGAYKLKAENNARNPHESFFRTAQWADPYRSDQPYGQWRASNGNPDDFSVTETDPATSQPGKVYYFPATDATTLEQNVASAAAYIVQGSAALSAPATPSTGARTTSQAFFGIFKNSRFPIWSGNLYSLGILRSLNAVTNIETLSFYGAAGESTIDCILVPDPADPSGLTFIKVCGLDNFDAHHLWSAFDIFGKYLVSDYPINVTPMTAGVAGGAGGVLGWDQRKIYTLDSTNARVDFKDHNSNPTLVASLVTQFGTLGDVVFNALSAAQKTAAVDAFINFIRGRHRDTVNHPTLNRIDIMGDVINSAPLAVEIGQDNVSSLPSNITWPSTGTDPHVRLILVGTNQGILHCFAESAYKDGTGFVKSQATEAWAFIPPDMLSTMFEIYQNQAVEDAFPHHYLVDGSPALYWKDVPPTGAITADTRVNPTENAIVIFGMRKGARSYYALSISGTNAVGNPAGTPGSPKFLWKLDPQDPTSTGVVKRMGASSAIPTFASVTTDGTIKTKTDVVFIPGGYANYEINDRFRATVRIPAPITATQGLGQSILALNPVTGAVVESWDWSNNATKVGAISAAITPVGILLGSSLIHRIYFADYKGNVMALDSSVLSSLGTKFRIDSSKLGDWRTTPRFIYQNSAHRFTTRPDAFMLSGNYPVAVVDTNSDGKPDLKPMTAMVSVGSGDWNNPTDADESYTVGASSFTSLPPSLGRMFVFTDRQDSANLGSRDATGILDTELQSVDDNTSGAATWATSYSDARVTIGSPTYFLATKSGYYFSLLNGALPNAYSGVTHDKVLVSPLIKESALFFSIFNINGNTGFDCSSNTFTRTFRECDILRPLSIATQSSALASQRVGNTDDLSRGLDSCNGLAFYFNSLSSELADTGDRVIQGGAVTAASGAANFSQQTGVNTPTLENVKDTSVKRGFKLRNWRIVR